MLEPKELEDSPIQRVRKREIEEAEETKENEYPSSSTSSIELRKSKRLKSTHVLQTSQTINASSASEEVIEEDYDDEEVDELEEDEEDSGDELEELEEGEEDSGDDEEGDNLDESDTLIRSHRQPNYTMFTPAYVHLVKAGKFSDAVIRKLLLEKHEKMIESTEGSLVERVRKREREEDTGTTKENKDASPSKRMKSSNVLQTSQLNNVTSVLEGGEKPEEDGEDNVKEDEEDDGDGDGDGEEDTDMPDTLLQSHRQPDYVTFKPAYIRETIDKYRRAGQHNKMTMIVKDGAESPSVSKLTAERPGQPSNRQPDMYSPPPYGSASPFYGYDRDRGESAKRRFWRALAVALFIWLLLGMLIRSIVDLAVVRRHVRGSDGIAKDWPQFSSGEVTRCFSRADWSSSFTSTSARILTVQQEQRLLQDENTESKIEGTPSDMSAGSGFVANPFEPPFHSNSSFSLPAHADLLYFLSRGSLAHGSVRFDVADSSSPGYDPETVVVDVRIAYWTSQALERAAVCRLTKGDPNGHRGQHGVGIFTPHNWHAGRPIELHDRLRFDVTVHLPASSSFGTQEPRVYTAIETDYSNFQQEFGDLQGRVAFDSVDVKTSNAHIAAENIDVTKGSFKTSNSEIIGSYNTTGALKLVTSNARIAVKVDMHSARLVRPTELLLKTSNGAIDSALSLYASAAGGGADSAFGVQTVTSNAASSLAVLAHPSDAQLMLECKTSNHGARVALHPAFEGAYALRTSNSAARVDAGRVEDPSGHGRERTVMTESVWNGRTEGKVWWGEWANWKKSWVHVTTSNGPVELKLREVGEV
ncbi:hypothetical protein EW145_g3313 [Phellinidium pouzarii]|uniref:Uncharacterized protein n=1 Tax=Phellinidium pouzarii TaxID=167371 RepID=A0A4S4L7I4_9AGAM|nr:hypothetical protein EW145_g3313 [Phellinidium pouzarii]